MKRVFFCIGLLFFSAAFATDESENQASSHPNEPTSNNSSQSSVFDRVFELITEGAVSNHDFGKDISDR
jgi:hypothetical protein